MYVFLCDRFNSHINRFWTVDKVYNDFLIMHYAICRLLYTT